MLLLRPSSYRRLCYRPATRLATDYDRREVQITNNSSILSVKLVYVGLWMSVDQIGAVRRHEMPLFKASVSSTSFLVFCCCVVQLCITHRGAGVAENASNSTNNDQSSVSPPCSLFRGCPLQWARSASTSANHASNSASREGSKW